MTSAGDLLALQEIDLNRDVRRALIADIDYRLGETETLTAARDLVATREAELTNLQREQRDVEARIEDMDAKVRPLEAKLYGGSVRNPKELTDLQKEVEGWKARRGKLDEEGLLNMEALEAAVAAIEAARAALSEVEAGWRADQEELLADRGRAEREAATLEKERQQRVGAMETAAIGVYEILRPLKQGKAVARIERGACQGCRLSLPTHVVQRTRAGDVLVHCPSCERILVSG